MVYFFVADTTTTEIYTFFKVMDRIEQNLVAEGGDSGRGIEW